MSSFAMEDMGSENPGSRGFFSMEEEGRETDEGSSLTLLF